jgi:hypothetical protein
MLAPAPNMRGCETPAGKGTSKRHWRLTRVKESGDGTWGNREWNPRGRVGQASF